MKPLSEDAQMAKLPYRVALFWDADPSEIDTKKHARYLIERILFRGDIAEFKWAKKTYGEEKIKEVVLRNKVLDMKSQNFWCTYFNINPTLCISNQLNRTLGLFWKK